MKKSPLISIFLVLLWTTHAFAGEIHLSAAASLKNALGDMIAAFGKNRPETVVLTNFGASGSLAKQVVQGAPADIFISADGQWVDVLVTENKGAADSRQTLAATRLVFAGQPGSAASLADLAKLHRIAIGSPGSVPAGRYAEQAMRKAGVYEELAEQKKLVMAQDVRQALLYADRGEVDGAFVYATDALLAERAKVLFEVPPELHDPIVYPMLMTRSGASRQEVREFFRWLASDEAAAILKRYGFTLPAR
jgi:molybdate transport system substrate-binding protein